MVSLSKTLTTAVMAIAGAVHAASIPNLGLEGRDVSPAADPVSVDTVGSTMRVTNLNGNLIAGYSAVTGGQAYIRVARSTDNGNSWSQIGVVASRPSGETDLSNAFPLNVNGRLLMAFRNHDKVNGGYTYYRITICESTDGGVTWSFLTQLDERAAASPKNGLWEPFLRIAKDGSIQAYYSAENNDGDQDNIMRKSTDGGKTWSGVIPVTGSNVNARDGMTGVAEIGGGQLMVVFESNLNGGKMGVYAMTSTDDGLTWGSRRQIYAVSGNGVAGAPQIAYVGSTIVVNFMSNEAQPSLPDVDAGEQRALVSTNNGDGWSGVKVLSGLGSHWPGLYTLDSSNFLSLYAINGKGLVSQRFSL